MQGVCLILCITCQLHSYFLLIIDFNNKGSSTAAPNANQEERGDPQQPSGQGNQSTGSGGENPVRQGTSRISEGPAFAGDTGVRVLPIRTMVAALNGPFSRLPSDSSGNSVGLYYPVLGRYNHVSSVRGTQASSEHRAAGVHAEQLSSENAAQQHNTGDLSADGNRVLA